MCKPRIFYFTNIKLAKQLIYLDLFPRHSNGYFLVCFYKLYAWYLLWQAWLWHHMVVTRVTVTKDCWRNNQVTWSHGTMTSSAHVTMLQLVQFRDDSEYLNCLNSNHFFYHNRMGIDTSTSDTVVPPLTWEYHQLIDFVRGRGEIMLRITMSSALVSIHITLIYPFS